MHFNLGDTLKDKITGFKGVAIAHCEYLTGCDQYCLKPKINKDGKVEDGVWVDVESLEKVSGTKAVVINKRLTSGPQSDAPNL